MDKLTKLGLQAHLLDRLLGTTFSRCSLGTCIHVAAKDQNFHFLNGYGYFEVKEAVSL